MDINKNSHYQNEHGFQLNDFFKVRFNREYLIGWYTCQVLKYLSRAGKKDGESEQKDLNKAFDYFEELWKIQQQVNLETGNNITYQDLLDDIKEVAFEFQNWLGQRPE